MILEVHDTYQKDEKLRTNFEATDDSDAINKAYLDEKEKDRRTYFMYKKDYNEIKLQDNKQSLEDTLFQKVVKTTI